MSGVRLSPRHGVNPTLAVCFWCGEERGDIALLGRIGGREDRQAPHRAVVDFQPCEKCRTSMNSGFTLMEATAYPNGACSAPMQDGVYPTGTLVRYQAGCGRQDLRRRNIRQPSCFRRHRVI